MKLTNISFVKIFLVFINIIIQFLKKSVNIGVMNNSRTKEIKISKYIHIKT